jgi:hypothetical protein
MRVAHSGWRGEGTVLVYQGLPELRIWLFVRGQLLEHVDVK